MSNMEDFMDFEKRQMHDDKIKMYSLLIANASELEHKYNITKLQLVENYISLINYKRSLYFPEAPTVIPFKDLCKNAANYINKLHKKEITKRTKCGERDDYNQLMSILRISFGFDPKEVNDISFEGYDVHTIWIYFTDKRTKEKFLLRTPNLNSGYYKVDLIQPSCFVNNVEQYLMKLRSIRDDLETRVNTYRVIGNDRTRHPDIGPCIGTFPSTFTTLSDLGKRYYAAKINEALDDILEETKNEAQGN